MPFVGSQVNWSSKMDVEPTTRAAKKAVCFRHTRTCKRKLSKKPLENVQVLPKILQISASEVIGPPIKAFSGGVWGSKHLLTKYLEDLFENAMGKIWMSSSWSSIFCRTFQNTFPKRPNFSNHKGPLAFNMTCWQSVSFLWFAGLEAQTGELLTVL